MTLEEILKRDKKLLSDPIASRDRWPRYVLALESVRYCLKVKEDKYLDLMEGANEIQFRQAEFAADAFRTLIAEIDQRITAILGDTK